MAIMWGILLILFVIVCWLISISDSFSESYKNKKDCEVEPTNKKTCYNPPPSFDTCIKDGKVLFDAPDIVITEQNIRKVLPQIADCLNQTLLSELGHKNSVAEALFENNTAYVIIYDTALYNYVKIPVHPETTVKQFYCELKNILPTLLKQATDALKNTCLDIKSNYSKLKVSNNEWSGIVNANNLQEILRRKIVNILSSYDVRIYPQIKVTEGYIYIRLFESGKTTCLYTGIISPKEVAEGKWEEEIQKMRKWLNEYHLKH